MAKSTQREPSCDRKVVYTVVLGWDYSLPKINFPDACDYVCFTDRNLTQLNGWTAKKIEPIFPTDPFRSSREYKIRAHRWLASYNTSLYIDSSVTLTADPTSIIREMMPDAQTQFGALFHSFRDTLLEEFAAVKKHRLDFEARLTEQMQAYQSSNTDVLHQKPVWGGFLARRHNEAACIDTMETWFAHVLRYSRRDQLSLPVALNRLSNAQKRITCESIFRSPFHRWPTGTKSKPPYQKVSNSTMRTQDSNHRPPPPETTWCKFGYSSENGLYFAQDKKTDDTIYVSHRRRLNLYKKGIQHRQNWILGDYRIPHDLLREGETMLDVGANIGELGVWVEARNGKYIGFEPDPLAFRALGQNVRGKIFDLALSNENATADFFLSTSTADSSLFEPDESTEKVSVKVARLDDILENIDVSNGIKLLKVEAEGTEPEVLEGAMQTLNMVTYVAVDAGPERGGEATAPEVLNFLSDRGFKIVSCFLKRGTFLLKRA